jgi:hypothetical protein
MVLRRLAGIPAADIIAAATRQAAALFNMQVRAWVPGVGWGG